MATKPIHIPFTPNPSSSNFGEYFSSKRGRSMLFNVNDSVGIPIFPYSLALHMQPGTFSEKMFKSKVVATTYGGYVEWIWPDELDSVSCSASTGAFLGPSTGLVSGNEGQSFRAIGPSDGNVVRRGSKGRRSTIAWERQEDLLDLFRNGGLVYNGQGQPVIRGRVVCTYDRGIYQGHFTTLDISETDDHPFSFDLSWEFKVEKVIYIFPISSSNNDFSLSTGPKVMSGPGNQPATLDGNVKPGETPTERDPNLIFGETDNKRIV